MVERADIEAKARQIEQVLTETKESVQERAMIIVVAVVALVALAFVVGRRRGKKSSAFVEVYKA